MIDHDAIINEQLLDQSIVEEFEYEIMHDLGEVYDEELNDRYTEEGYDYVEEWEETRFTGTKIA